MKKVLVGATAILICVACFVFAEGTVSESEVTIGNPNKLTLSWTSSTNSFVSYTTGTYRGEIKRIVFVPSATAQPTASYDMTLNDENSIDVLAGQGANLASNANASVIGGVMITDGVNSNPAPFVINGPLTLSVTNCGALKSGQVILYYQP